jgi:hypothetical protein
MGSYLFPFLGFSWVLLLTACGGDTAPEPAATTPSTPLVAQPRVTNSQELEFAIKRVSRIAVMDGLGNIESDTVSYACSNKQAKGQYIRSFLDGDLVRLTVINSAAPGGQAAKTIYFLDDGVVYHSATTTDGSEEQSVKTYYRGNLIAAQGPDVDPSFDTDRLLGAVAVGAAPCD